MYQHNGGQNTTVRVTSMADVTVQHSGGSVHAEVCVGCVPGIMGCDNWMPLSPKYCGVMMGLGLPGTLQLTQAINAMGVSQHVQCKQSLTNQKDNLYNSNATGTAKSNQTANCQVAASNSTKSLSGMATTMGMSCGMMAGGLVGVLAAFEAVASGLSGDDACKDYIDTYEIMCDLLEVCVQTMDLFQACVLTECGKWKICEVTPDMAAECVGSNSGDITKQCAPAKLPEFLPNGDNNPAYFDNSPSPLVTALCPQASHPANEPPPM
jgi:hypothetical protein